MALNIFKRISAGELSQADILKLSTKDINAQNDDRNTPLHYAIINKKTNIAINLLKNDAIDFTIINDKNNTILDEAILSSNDDIIQAIIENKKINQLLKSESLYRTAMQNMLKKEKWDFIEEFFNKLSEKELNDYNNFEIWTEIVKNKNSDDLAEKMYNKLVTQINEESEKFPYFNQAIESNQWVLSKQILDSISDEAIHPLGFKNTFIIALEAKQLDIAKDLIEKVETRAFTNKNIIFPILEKVVAEKYWEIRDQLINKISENLELNSFENNECKLLVHYAIKSENWIVADQLVNELPSEMLCIKSTNNFTALHLAIAKGNNQLVLNLIDKIPSQDLIDRDSIYSCTALDMAINNKQVNVMIKLIEKLPFNSINDPNIDGDSAIHIALRQNDPKILQAIKFCHQGDINFNIKNNANQTPLDLLDENSARIFRFPKINGKYKNLEFNKYKGDFSESTWKKIESTLQECEISKKKLNGCPDNHELNEELKKKKPEKEIIKTIIIQELHKKNRDLELSFNEYCDNVKRLKELKKQARKEMTHSLNSLSMQIDSHLSNLNESNIKCQRQYTIEQSNNLELKPVVKNINNLQIEQSGSNYEDAIKLSVEYNSLEQKRLYIADNIESVIYLFKENDFKDHEYGRPAIIVGYNKNDTSEVLFLPGTSQKSSSPHCEIILELKISENDPLPEKRSKITYFFSGTFRWKNKDCIKKNWYTNVRLTLENKQCIAKKLGAEQINNLEQELGKINILRQKIIGEINLRTIKLSEHTAELESDFQSKSETMKARIRKRAEENRNKQKESNEYENEINKLEMQRINTNSQNKQQNRIYEKAQATKNKKRADLDLIRQQKLSEFYELQNQMQNDKKLNSKIQQQQVAHSSQYKQNLTKFNETCSEEYKINERLLLARQTLEHSRGTLKTSQHKQNLAKFNEACSGEYQIDQKQRLARQKLDQLNSRLTKKANESQHKQDSEISIEQKESNMKIKQASLKSIQNLEEKNSKEKQKQKEKELIEEQEIKKWMLNK